LPQRETPRCFAPLVGVPGEFAFASGEL
jgi:hypothetical protein